MKGDYHVKKNFSRSRSDHWYRACRAGGGLVRFERVRTPGARIKLERGIKRGIERNIERERVEQCGLLELICGFFLIELCAQEGRSAQRRVLEPR